MVGEELIPAVDRAVMSDDEVACWWAWTVPRQCEAWVCRLEGINTLATSGTFY